MGIPREFAEEDYKPRRFTPDSSSTNSDNFEYKEEQKKIRAREKAEYEANLYKDYCFLREYLDGMTEIPEGYQIKITEEALDRWISAHYEFPGNYIPASIPSKMPVAIFEAIKRHDKRVRKV